MHEKYFQVKTIDSKQTRALRQLVLWPHIASEDLCIIDIDDRADAIHFGTFDDSRIVSVGSFFEISSPKLSIQKQYRLRAMATHPDYRGMNCGKLLLDEAIINLRTMGVEAVWCDARLGAVGFYESIGFEKFDEVYDVPKIGPHKFMWIRLQPSS